MIKNTKYKGTPITVRDLTDEIRATRTSDKRAIRNYKGSTQKMIINIKENLKTI